MKNEIRHLRHLRVSHVTLASVTYLSTTGSVLCYRQWTKGATQELSQLCHIPILALQKCNSLNAQLQMLLKFALACNCQLQLEHKGILNCGHWMFYINKKAKQKPQQNRLDVSILRAHFLGPVQAGRKDSIRNDMVLEMSVPAQHCCSHRKHCQIPLQAVGLRIMVFEIIAMAEVSHHIHISQFWPDVLRVSELNCPLPSILPLWRFVSMW